MFNVWKASKLLKITTKRFEIIGIIKAYDCWRQNSDRSLSYQIVIRKNKLNINGLNGWAIAPGSALIEDQ